MKRFLIFLLVLAALVQPALAGDGDWNTSGTVTYSSGVSKSYSLTETFHGEKDPEFKYIAHRFTDAQYLDSIIVRNALQSTVEYDINNFVTFTSTVDGVFYGSGIVGVTENAADYIDYEIYFYELNESYAATLTGNKMMVLTFDSSVFAGTEQIAVIDSDYALASSVLGVNSPTALCTSTVVITYVWSNYDVPAGAVSYLVSYNNYYANDYEYSYNDTLGLSTVEVTRTGSSSMWDVHNVSGGTYFADSAYSDTNVGQSFIRGAGVHANITYNVDGGVTLHRVFDTNGTSEDEEEDEEDEYENWDVWITNDSYYRGDLVSVHYNTTGSGAILIHDEASNTWHYKTISSASTNGLWNFYIASDEPYGNYTVILGAANGDMVDVDHYDLTSSTAFLEVVPTYIYLYETMVIWYKTSQPAILSVVQSQYGVEVYNETVDSSVMTYVEYTPTQYTGGYYLYLYDVETLEDDVSVWYAEPPEMPTETDDDTESEPTATSTPHEYTNDEIVSELRQIIPPIFFLVLLIFVILVISGG